MSIPEHETLSYTGRRVSVHSEGSEVHCLTSENMSNDKETSTSVQRRGKPSEDDPLPREKLPESLQKIVDNEESLMEQIYDGTYVECPFPANSGAFPKYRIEQISLRIQIFDMQHMPVDSVQYYSVRTAMWPIPQT